MDELTRTAGQLLLDVSDRATETVRRANESEQVRQVVTRASETADYIEQRAREFEPVAREKASQAFVELQDASRLAKNWLRQKLEERPQGSLNSDGSLDPEGTLDPKTHINIPK